MEEEINPNVFNQLMNQKKSVADQLTEVDNLPEEVKKKDWHFTSKLLSSSFFTPNERKDLEDIFWISSFFKMKDAKNLNADFFRDHFQVLHHSMARFNQSVGTTHRDQTNLTVLLTKTFQVLEQVLSNQDKKRFTK